MLDIRFFQNRRFSAANAAITMVFFAMFGSMFLITQYLQIVLGFSALEAGLRMLPMAGVMLITAPMAPRLAEKVGTKVVVGGGLLLAAGAMAYASAVPASDGYPHLVTAMAFLAVGMGLTMAPATESVMGALPPAKAGVGSAMNDTTRQVGGALGVAVIGSLFASSYRPGITDGLEGLGLSSSSVDAAKDSVGAALEVASRLPGPLGDTVTRLANQQFVDGLQLACLVAAGIVFAAALVVFAFLPARSRDLREPVSGPVDGLASVTFAEAEGVLEADELEKLGAS
jgi:Na+/melibiose symporter-like transporter